MILASKIALKRSENNEQKLRKELAKYFQKIEKEVQQLLKEYGHTEHLLQGQLSIILSPIKASHGEYYDIIAKHILREYDLGTAEGDRLTFLNNPLLTTAVMNEIRRNNLFGTLKYTEDRLLNRSFIASESTIARVDESINEIITDGYKSGKGIDYVSQQVQARFEQLQTWEATRIARTEIHNAHNEGIMKSYETLGVEYTQWIAANDDRVRDSHAEIDGEIIPFGGTYSNGLAYPGDTSGDIEEWINCRCSNAPYVMPAGMMAPPGMAQFREDDLVPIS
jgi:SPP1 gp7 family putative phage head morphogenesis protein